ncbi:hypothetical protein ABZ434_20320 [Streptomyces sp. NPDC005761]|uniref:hypothetical protein n=1 Tax=Streptomyces sp. NPDC005761 TaxID=3157066 RepID=UPI0033FFDD52
MTLPPPTCEKLAGGTRATVHLIGPEGTVQQAVSGKGATARDYALFDTAQVEYEGCAIASVQLSVRRGYGMPAALPTDEKACAAAARSGQSGDTAGLVHLRVAEVIGKTYCVITDETDDSAGEQEVRVFAVHFAKKIEQPAGPPALEVQYTTYDARP